MFVHCMSSIMLYLHIIIFRILHSRCCFIFIKLFVMFLYWRRVDLFWSEICIVCFVLTHIITIPVFYIFINRLTGLHPPTYVARGLKFHVKAWMFPVIRSTNLSFVQRNEDQAQLMIWWWWWSFSIFWMYTHLSLIKY